VLCCPKAQRSQALDLVDRAKLSKLASIQSLDMEEKEESDFSLQLEKLQVKTRLFNVFVAALHSIVANLPRQPLGKNVSWVEKFILQFVPSIYHV
jgi:hypothetical protein